LGSLMVATTLTNGGRGGWHHGELLLAEGVRREKGQIWWCWFQSPNF
jgi:hypothetical protein